MKKLSKKLILATVIATVGTNLFAQNQWRTNVLQTFTGGQQNILGTDANAPASDKLDIRFYTDANERMRLIGEPGSNLGYLGLGTPSPIFKLDVSGGGIIARGGNEVLPNGLSGNRMIWYPAKSAFRAGNAGNQWDDANIGVYSVAFGGKTQASGVGSFAAGNSAVASGGYSFSFGNNVNSTGVYSSTFGNSNNTSGIGSLTAGQGNNTSADYSATFGGGNTNSGSHSLIFGQYVNTIGSWNFAGGTSVAISGGLSMAYGENVIATGFGTYSHGQAVRNYAAHGHAKGLYIHIPSQATRSFIFGEGDPAGVGLSGYLTSDIGSSFTIGFKSNVPTFFVSPASGMGTSGNVRIGTPSNVSGLPTNRLELNSDVNDASGLTFTQLTALSPSLPANSSNTILTVDDNGVVILVDDQSGVFSGTDDQLITDFSLSGNVLTVEIEDGNSISVDLSNLQDGTGTDDQNLTSAILNSMTNILTISIEDGSSVSVDLSSLVSTGDADWFNSAPGFQTTPPTAITDNIYTQGNVGINTVGTSQAQLTINPNGQLDNPFLINGTNARFQISQGGNIGIGYNAGSNALINATNVYLANPIGHGISLQLQNLDVGPGGVASGIYVTNNSPNENQAAGVHATANALRNAYGVQGVSYGTGQNDYGVYGTARNGSVHSIGVYGIVPGGDFGVPSSYTSGVVGIELSTKSKDKRGVTALASYNAGGTPVGVETYGVKALAASGNRNYGGEFIASGGPSGATNFGVYAKAVGAGATNWAGYFQGNVNVAGVLTVYNVPVLISDQKFKTKVENIQGAIDLIKKLRPTTYLMDTKSYPEFNFESDQQFGLIAQEVEKVIPSIVEEQTRPAMFDSLGNKIYGEMPYKGIQYTELIPVLIAGMQEQQTEIDQKDEMINDLNLRLSTLENCLKNLLPQLCEMNNDIIENTNQVNQERLKNIINLELNDGQNIVLNQNVPNPFAESTVITYFIPETVIIAEIQFYNELGSLINSVVIDSRGNGQVNVYGNDLGMGSYSYSLLADGILVTTKRMVKK